MATEDKLNDIDEAAGVAASRGGLDLTSWEEDFIESVKDQLNERGFLSDRQKAIIIKIWARI